MVIGFEFTT